MQIIPTTVGAIAGVVAALLDVGYWALVIMQLATAVTMCLGMWMVCGWRPGWPMRGVGVRSMLAFGGNLTGANLLGYLVRNLDHILIGWRWGADALGFYAKAYQLLLLPVAQFNMPLSSVAIPALSRLQNEPERYRFYYRKALQLLVSAGMPVVVFMFVAADKVVLLILGDQWLEAIPIFRLLAPAAFLGTFNVAGGWVFVSLGRTDRQLRWTAVSTAVTVTAFLIGLPWGAVGVAAAFSIAQCVLRGPGIAYCYHGTFLGFGDLVQPLWRPAVAACAAGALLMAAEMVTPAAPTLWAAILVDLFAYVLFYMVWWFAVPGGPRIVGEMLGMLKVLRPRPVDPDRLEE
jgi:O-antigen/teichoic acid export membrane protein